MAVSREYINISVDEYSELLEKLKAVEAEKTKLARDLRIQLKRNEINRLNYETQTGMTKIVTYEKQRQEMYVKLLLESCLDIMLVFDENMEFLLGTNSIKEVIGVDDISLLQGLTFDAIIEQYHPLVFTKEILALTKKLILSPGVSDPIKNLEVSVKNNRYEFNILPFQKTNGKFAGILVDMHDITEIVITKELAEQASLAKGDFLSHMSHEMRTPMNAIIGMTGIAKNSNDPEKKEYCLDKIEGASKHLLGVINDILDMSKIEANKFELDFNPFVFKKMLTNITNVLNFRVEEKQQHLIINVDDNIPATIVGDELRLTQVITNLMTNAVKFTPDGGTITLTAHDLPAGDGAHTLQIAVADNGIGISEEQKSRLFTSFVQADGGTTRKYGGTGLGLAISKRIVEMMGGQIWIESTIGVGSKFIFTIAYEKGELKQDPDAYKADAGPGGEPSDIEKSFNYSGHTILIAEDIDINREIIATILEETGISIDFAENGMEAVTMFKEHPHKYSLILMDIQMPFMDGYDATRKIRAEGYAEAAAIPIVAMTASVFREDVEKCLESGMNDHLGKPVDTGDLFDKLEKYL